MDLIDKYSKDSEFESNFATYLKALIKRYNGEINDSLDLLRKCYNYNENNVIIMKEIGKSMSLLGKHTMAIDIYDEILSRSENDWEAWHEKGVCCVNLKSYEIAYECFEKALSLCSNEQT
jgi:Bardet-Biedl syndrome 4 protein